MDNFAQRLAEPVFLIDWRIGRRDERAERADVLDQRVNFGIAVERSMSSTAYRSRATRRSSHAAARMIGRGPSRSNPSRRRKSRRSPSPGAPSACSNHRSKALSNNSPATSSAATSNIGSTRASTGRSRRRSAQNEWIVPIRASSSWPSASESRARSAEPREGSLPRVLDFGAQPQFELSGGLLGEGHGDDSAKLGAPARQRRDDPVD